jgi:beta-1,4-N-acetylglucosaminyltransferase
MNFPKIFVTVGTTEFSELIEKLSQEELYDILKNQLNCKKLTIQFGHGKVLDFNKFEDIQVEQFDLKSDIKMDIEEADLIISHAGAGTCIDVLTSNKPLLVVINDTLMNNHQIELAEQLAKDGYLFYSNVKDLPNTLHQIDTSKLRKYEPGNIDKFILYLDNYFGFC